MDVISLLRSTVESKVVDYKELVDKWNQFENILRDKSDSKFNNHCDSVVKSATVFDDRLKAILIYQSRHWSSYYQRYNTSLSGSCLDCLKRLDRENETNDWDMTWYRQNILFNEWFSLSSDTVRQSAIVAQHKLLLTRHDEIQSVIDAKKKELDDLTLKCEAHHQELQTLTTLRIEYDVMRCDMISLKRQRDAYDHLDECVNKVNEYRESESKRLHEVDMMMQEDNASSLIRARTHLQKEFDDKRQTMFVSVRDCQAKMKDAKERYETQLKKLDQERQELLDEHQRLKSELDERSHELDERSHVLDDDYQRLEQRLTHPETILKSADSIIASSKIYETIKHIKSSSTLSQLSFDDISHLAEWMNYKLIVKGSEYYERHDIHLDQLLGADMYEGGMTVTIDEADIIAHSQTPFKDLPELMKVIAIMNKFKICLNDDHPDTAIKRFVYDFTSVIDRYLIEHLTEKR